MKKTYIKPVKTELRISHNFPIAGSITINSLEGTGRATFYDANATGEAMVKGNSKSYNVWDDDWSK